MLGTLLQSLFGRQTVRGRQQSYFRPRVEQLEDRLLLATFLVNDPGDANRGTGMTGDLLYCINKLNMSTDPQNTINFDAFQLTGATIKLTTALPDISKNVTINGLGAANLTIQAQPPMGQFYSVFGIAPPAVVTISGLTITGGNGFDALGDGTITDGGGIYNQGALTLTNDVVKNNSVIGTPILGGGGGLYNAQNATLTLNGTTVSLNNSNGGASAAGIDNVGVLIINSSPAGPSQIKDNTATGSGGGIYNEVGGQVTITNSTISGNTAGKNGGGILNSDRLQIRTSSFSNNKAPNGNGGAIWTGGTGYIGNTTIQGGTANKGAGIYAANAQAGALLKLDHVTDANNKAIGITIGGASPRGSGGTPGGYLPGIGGGLYVEDGAEVDIVNTIIATNTTTDEAPDALGIVNSQGYNLIGIGDDSSGWMPGLDLVGTSASPIDPLLNPLGDYGGPTLSMTLQAGSPALMAGNPAADDSPTDQRGFARIVNGFTDIGAVEMQPGEFSLRRR